MSGGAAEGRPRASLTRMRGGESSKASLTSDLCGSELFWDDSAAEEGCDGSDTEQATCSGRDVSASVWPQLVLKVILQGGEMYLKHCHCTLDED